MPAGLFCGSGVAGGGFPSFLLGRFLQFFQPQPAAVWQHNLNALCAWLVKQESRGANEVAPAANSLNAEADVLLDSKSFRAGTCEEESGHIVTSSSIASGQPAGCCLRSQTFSTYTLCTGAASSCAA